MVAPDVGRLVDHQQVVDRAPKLTDEQVERIRALLGLGRPVTRGQEVGDAKAP